MAISFVDEGSYDQALETLQKQYEIAAAQSDFGGMSGDVNVMGNILLEMGRYEEALKKFEETVTLQAQAKNASDQVKELAKVNFQFDAGRVAARSGELPKAKISLTGYQTQAEAQEEWIPDLGSTPACRHYRDAGKELG